MKIFFFPLVLILFCSCGQDKELNKYTILGLAQGTDYKIIYYSDKESVLKENIDSILNEFDNSCSLYKESSLINRINSGETTLIDENIEYCVNTANRISQQSDGAYDITIKPLTQAMGFAGKDPQYKPNIDSILQYIGYKNLNIESGNIMFAKEGMQIDLNSIAQGYSVDLLSEYLSSKGIDNYLVYIGGEIYTKGCKSDKSEWKVGIDKPKDGNMVPGEDMQVILYLTERGLATSGNYRKFYQNEDGERINHTLDPKTGKSVDNNLLSATVVAKNAAEADAYGTMFMVIGLQKSIEFLKTHKELDAYLIYWEDNDYRIYITDNLINRIVK